ncbi:MAG: hypothetical protein V4515_12735 [Chloroflexota bacterium]
MPSVAPFTQTWTDGVSSSSEMNNYVRDPLNFLLRPPMAELRQIVAQTLTTGVAAALTFTASDVDQDYLGGTGHSNSVNTSRYTANFSGWYQVSGQASYVANATGRRGALWAVNGTPIASGQLIGPATAASDIEFGARVKFVYLNAGDYAELLGFQESGGNLATIVSFNTVLSGASIRWVSN